MLPACLIEGESFLTAKERTERKELERKRKEGHNDPKGRIHEMKHATNGKVPSIGKSRRHFSDVWKCALFVSSKKCVLMGLRGLCKVIALASVF